MSAPAEAELVSPYWRLDAAEQDLGLLRMCGQLPATARAVLAVVRRAAPRQALMIVVLQTVSGCATAFGLLATAGVLQVLVSGDPAAALPAVVLVVGAYALRGSLDAGVALAHARLTPAVRRLGEGELFSAALRAELADFDDPAFYDRMQRARDRGVFHLEGAVRNLVELIGAAVSVAAAGASVGVLHPALLPVLAVGLLPRGWSVLQSGRQAYRHVTRTVTLNRRVRMVCDLATEREAAAEIRACQAQGFLLREYAEVADPLRDEEVAAGVGQARTQAIGRVLYGVATGVTYLALGLLLQAGWIPLAVAGAAVIAVRTVNGSLGQLVFASHQLLEQGRYVTDYLDFVTARQDGPPGVAAPAAPARLTLHDVGFRYPGSARDALRDVNLTIHAGQTIALVGENGSGKSTLAKLLANLYRPTGGWIGWDGADIAAMDPDSVIDRIVLVPQEPVRWPHTARANVRAGRHDRHDPGDRALRAAAGLSGADDVVAGLPQGWETLLSKYFRGGQELSVGQWQKLAIARGLFRDAPLLIWDEPTAPLDAKAEFTVYESLRRLASGRTVILITHRLASVRNADQIYLLHEGAVVERGTHAELLALSGRYAELHELQERMASNGRPGGSVRERSDR